MSQIPPGSPWQQPPGYSNYPRASQSPDPYGRPPGIYFDTIGMAWNLVQANLGTWVLSVLVAGIIMITISVGFSFGANLLLYGGLFYQGPPSITPYITGQLVSLVPNLIVGIFTSSLFYMGVKTARGEQIGVGDIFCGFSCFLPLMIAVFLQQLIVMVGLCLLVIPGIFLIGALAFVPLLVIDRNMNPIEAITESYNVLRQHAWSMFALLFVGALIYFLGACLCGVGALFTHPIYLVIVGLTYNTFYPRVQMVAQQQQIGIEPPR
jgi:hypothetical protein